MSEVWDIPAVDEQEILVLTEEGQEGCVTHAADDASVEIVQVDESPYLVESGSQAIVGSVHEIIGQDNLGGTQVTLCSDWGSRYTGIVQGGIRPLTSNVAFATTGVLHEGRYWGRRLRVEFLRNPNIEEWQIPVYLPLLRIHRPHRDGCTAEAIARATGGTENSATFEFLGINKGRGQGFTTELSLTFRAGDICKEEVIPATLIVEHGATLVDGQPVAYGARYGIVGVKPSEQKTRPVPSGIDRCQRTPSPLPQPTPPGWRTFDKRAVPPSDANKDDIGTKFGSTDYVSVGLGGGLASAPLSLSVEMKRTVKWEYEVNTTLKGGAWYLCFPASPSAQQLPFEMCWSVLDEIGSTNPAPIG